MDTNTLYFGDNLHVLRNRIPDASVDLVYLDPPFSSARNYFVIFKDRTGKASAAQQEAFTDTWSWGEEAEATYKELLTACPNHHLATTIQALRSFLRETPMMAYLVSMAIRLVELHRVLKATGSLYLHCDSTASHYLKILLDTIFGPQNFRTEITWQRTNVHNDSKTRWADVSDIVFFYTKSNRYTWNPQYLPHSKEYVADKYRNKDANGRAYQLDNMTSPNPRPNLMYEWKGHTPPPNGWRYSVETMTRLDSEGRIWYPDDKSKRPRLKRYLDEMTGTIIGNVWTDIDPINPRATERLGYPTQKPLALLERIIAASSNPGDILLDAFCGCGTSIHAAHKLNRRWVGIDITAVAVGIMKSRLQQAFAAEGLKVPIVGFPTDLEGARVLFESDPHQFQIWACTLVNALPLTKKGADAGIDGKQFFFDADGSEHQSVTQVKGGKNVQVRDVRDFCHVIDREKASLGFFLCLSDATRAMREEAVKMGFWTSKLGKDYPRAQVLTIPDLLEGRATPRQPLQVPASLLGYRAGQQNRSGQQTALDIA